MENQKLLHYPSLFEPWLNQTQIDLSKEKVKLISRETELIRIIQNLKYELFEVKNKINNLEDHNQFADMIHRVNLSRKHYGRR